jgi:hypothetical protein
MEKTKIGSVVSLFKDNGVYYQVDCRPVTIETLSFSNRLFGDVLFNKDTNEIIHSTKLISEPFRKHLRLATKVWNENHK